MSYNGTNFLNHLQNHIYCGFPLDVSQGGLGYSAITLVGGALKEGKDISKKLSNSEERKKYGGSLGVLKDSAKDMKNNFYGAGYGLTYRQNGDCNSLLKRKIK